LCGHQGDHLQIFYLQGGHRLSAFLRSCWFGILWMVCPEGMGIENNVTFSGLPTRSEDSVSLLACIPIVEVRFDHLVLNLTNQHNKMHASFQPDFLGPS
jgi:hypothetical protein